MAVRGSVIDFYPALSPYPIRAELQGATVQKLRYFDLESQRSYTECDSCTVYPVREVVSLKPGSLFSSLMSDARARIEARAKVTETPPREAQLLIKALETGEELPAQELLMAIALPSLTTIFEYLPPTVKVVLADEIGITQHVESFETILEERETRLTGDHYLIPGRASLFVSSSEFDETIATKTVLVMEALEKKRGSKIKHISHLPLTELTTKLKTKIGTGEAFQPLEDQITTWRKRGSRVAFVVGSLTRAERLQRILLDQSIDAPLIEGPASPWLRSGASSPVAIFQGYLSSGVVVEDEKLVFVSEHEIFGERSYRRSKTSKVNLKKILSSLAQLNENDYVVHADYGVGIYRGLEHREIEGEESDFLHIEYADSKLFLPVQNIGKVQKFVAAEGQAPGLDRLGSNQWVKTKEKIRESVLPLAADLIKLYAARTVAKGWRFEPYGAEDERFADEFPFNETPDQLKAIEETIRDMADEKPMDRLVCGDVGFGKTEVALRAAFKAVQHRKQVAVLAPTTLLVEQHFATFLNRLKGYDIAVGVLSRFHTPEHNKKTLEKISSGELDIVVGTHKLIQKDVLFNDLGLLIIDEEHRFGVKQKEQLKALKKQVDVLTLTATPIPRTLHMSLLGIRDISVISTPPTNRRVIRTYVATYDDTLVRDAILRELQRGGQVFFVHNRVQSIDLITATLRDLVPEARFAFAHGQMSERHLEDIMREFIDRKIDVLVATTIIESGIDIPNANTIIIDRADMYGLAQLYQLRGRVGRGDTQAYAYLVIPRTNKLNPEAQQRLKALQSLDDLGLGFNLAIRDLEIRGAGNLLGKEQSGSVLAVGFELYSKILKEAVLHLKGEEIDLQETIDPEVKLGINAFIPEWYIPDISERLVLYQRLSNVRSGEELTELQAEIEDRFGPIGTEVYHLIELMGFRSLLRLYGVVKAELKNTTLTLSFSPKAPVDLEKIFALVKVNKDKFRFGKSLTLSITFSKLKEPREVYAEAKKVLQRVSVNTPLEPKRGS